MSTSDKEYYQLTISISKALNGLEAPLKVKHARAAIIGTYRMHGAQSFWAVVLRQPLMENRFTAWKFCHLLHKVLREGHPLCLQHSLRHRKMLTEIGKMWGHLADGYGVCIRHYTKLLVMKLEFHERNPKFPGNLLLSENEFEQIVGNDMNINFQLAVEIFDYLDEIIALQATIFNYVNTFHITSMTAAGQCRLAPLIALIQDSNPLYDFSVRLMFKLHLHLPNDILAGHRERFRTIFNQLKSFYEQVRPLQYFADLIQVPRLPENAPNFNSRVDFGSYKAPILVVPEPEPDPVVDNLVDMSIPDNNRYQDIPDSNNHHHQQQLQQQQQQQDFDRLLQEQENIKYNLQMEIDRLSKHIKSMTISHREQMDAQEDQILRLNTQLTEAQEVLTDIRLKKEELELKAQSAPTLEQKAIAEEEKAKAMEEKFQKMKTMYTQIRDEHVKLLRQNGEVSKQLSTAKKEFSDLTTENELLKVQLEEFQQKCSRDEEELKKTLNAIKNEKDISEKYEKIYENYEQLKCRYDDLQADKSAEIAELRIKIDELEKIRNEYDNLNIKYNEIINTLKNIESDNSNLKKRIEQMSSEQTKIENKSKKTEESLDGIKIELENKLKDYEVLDEKSKNEIKLRDDEILNLKEKVNENEEKIKTTNTIVQRLMEEKSTIECELQDLLLQQGELEDKHKHALDTIIALQNELDDTKTHNIINLRSLLETCIKSSEKLAARAMNENEFTHATGTSSYFMMIAEELQQVLNELNMVYEKYSNDNNYIEGVARKTVLSGHLLATVQIQGMTICNTSSDIQCGERIANEIKHFCRDVMCLFETLHKLPEPSELSPKINIVKEKLINITNMIHDLSKTTENSGQIGDLLESELLSMDKAIEEAATKIVELLSNARASDSGIKLEVNQKILDACTNLMQAIRILVQKSRLLQGEIIALGKGTASAKEFYKRNHQWTEGLISAAKSVAQGANLLVTAANKAVTGESKQHFDLIVAAQEIAACTAQLVVASRVKAKRESKNLQGLSDASRNVTQATGVVVATAKDCSQHLQDSQDLDLTKLTVHQAKTLEMEIQVKVLELEQALQMERLRLSAFRRKNYQNSE